MVVHRYRRSSESGNGGEPLRAMDHGGSPIHVRMMRMPRSLNALTLASAGCVLLALYIAYTQHALRGALDTHVRGLVSRVDMLQATVDSHGRPVKFGGDPAAGGDTAQQQPQGGQGNVYLENHRQTPTVWVMSKSVHHLSHVITAFERIGYQIIRQPGRFDAIWSYDYPFSSGWKHHILDMTDGQKINHFPGSGYITNKMSLSTSKLHYLPKAYQIPKDVAALKEFASSNPDKMWVMKSNDHRGIKIKKLTDMDLSDKGRLNFVQEFVDKPLLIDGRKFDIGVYVTITSVNPLRVYMFEEEVLLRFCSEPYHPLDVANVEKYVIGDKYTPARKLESLKGFLEDKKYSAKETLSQYLKVKGFDPEKLWAQIRTSIREVTRAKESDIKSAMASYPNPSIFFEMVRFDFVVDEELQLWLMEVNMSPNLSSSVHPENAVMYEQVVFNTLALAGVAHYTAGPLTRLTQQEHSMRVRTSDVMVPVDECGKEECSHCAKEVCALCQHCVSTDQLKIFKAAFLEHAHRRSYRRILPIPPNESPQVKDNVEAQSAPNKIMLFWYKAKCNQNPAWCA